MLVQGISSREGFEGPTSKDPRAQDTPGMICESLPSRTEQFLSSRIHLLTRAHLALSS